MFCFTISTPQVIYDGVRSDDRTLEVFDEGFHNLFVELPEIRVVAIRCPILRISILAENLLDNFYHSIT
jgi:hypothetical protein